MWGILLVILLRISLLDSNGCKVSMCYIQWVGMRLVYLQSSMQLRYFLLPRYVFFKVTSSAVSTVLLLISQLLVDRQGHTQILQLSETLIDSALRSTTYPSQMNAD